eukprot:6331464-Alexandrium_andersonii.AAC.1
MAIPRATKCKGKVRPHPDQRRKNTHASTERTAPPGQTHRVQADPVAKSGGAPPRPTHAVCAAAAPLMGELT